LNAIRGRSSSDTHEEPAAEPADHNSRDEARQTGNGNVPSEASNGIEGRFRHEAFGSDARIWERCVH
jgi:hypothetical protein